MKNPLDHLEAFQNLRLSSEERGAIRAALDRHILLHPLPPIRSPYARFLMMPAFAFMALFLVVTGAGTSFAAKGALPGEPLYGFKVAFVEPVAGALRVTPAARAEWKVALAETRLQEAEELSARGTLELQSESVGARVADATARAAEEVEKLSAKDARRAKGIAKRLEATMRMNERAVLALSQGSDSSEKPVLVALADSRAPSHGAFTKAAPAASLRIGISEDASANAPAPEQMSFSATMALEATTTSETEDEVEAAPSEEESKQERYDRALELFVRVQALAEDGEDTTEAEDSRKERKRRGD